MMDAFLRIADLFVGVASPFLDWLREESAERSPEIVELNIRADYRAMVEAERMEQWRRWAADRAGNRPPRD